MRFSFLLLIFFTSPFLFSADQKAGDFESILRQALILFNASSENGTPIDSTCETLFQKAYEMRNDRKDLKAYRGSALCIMARDAVIPFDKLAKVQEGIRLLDEAVEEAPANALARMVRAETYNGLPDAFGKRVLGQQDLDFLVRLYAEDKKEFETSLEIGRVLYLKAVYQLKDGKVSSACAFAKAVLRFSKAETPRQDAQKLLEEIQQ